MHELTEKIEGYLGFGRDKVDNIITDWLKEKIRKIDTRCLTTPRDPFIKIMVEELGIKEEQSLEEKFEDYFLKNHNVRLLHDEGLCWEDMIDIAKQHFKEHPEELK